MKILQYGIVLLCIVALWGCGKGNPNAPVTINPVTQKHPAGWAANGAGGLHPTAYFANAVSCEECHGKPSDPAGGISGVSCSNPGRSGVACHPSFPHVAGFAAFAKHGSVAKDVASGVTGMAHCKQCHGSSYTGAGLAPNCIGCHKVTNPSSNAPHAAKWVNGNANGLKHSTTDATNAPACAQCHLGGTFSHAPPVPAPAGTSPGCFNGTLCHNAAGHALPYVTEHQAAAKANIASCQACHATPASGANPRFNLLKGSGVLNPNGCEDCHNKAGIAHPYMWLPGRGTTTTPSGTVVNATSHTTAGTVNVSCGLCHGGTAFTGGSGPSCMSTSINNTACHFTKPVAADGSSVGCTSCHGNPPSSVTSTAAPNRAFRHTAHFSNNLAGPSGPITCSACHAGFGSPTTTHSTKVVFTAVTAAVAIDPIFNENNLTATYLPITQQCSSVSCHGGRLLAPSWKNAAAFTQATCENCHRIQAGIGLTPSAYLSNPASPYIGPYSGNNVTFTDPPANTSPTIANNLHTAHIFVLTGTTSQKCLRCHAAPGAGHYANVMLGKRVLVPGFAAPTVAGTAIGTYTFTSPTISSCLTAGASVLPNALLCHDTGARSWYK